MEGERKRKEDGEEEDEREGKEEEEEEEEEEEDKRVESAEIELSEGADMLSSTRNLETTTAMPTKLDEEKDESGRSTSAKPAVRRASKVEAPAAKQVHGSVAVHEQPLV